MKLGYLAPLAVLVTAFAVTAFLGSHVITWLRKMKFGQKILEIGPKWHMNKQNIPTMGGIMFMGGIAIAMLVFAIAYRFLPMGEPLDMLGYLLVPLLALVYGMVGMIDDYSKIKKKQNAGLTPMQKLILQVVIAAVFVILLRISGDLRVVDDAIALRIPFTGVSLHLSWVVYIIFTTLVVVGADNAVNLTDGIDGLAASVTLPIALFFALFGMRIGNIGVAIFAAALAGGLLGFLLFNVNPAKVFMGDTGSLFLGGAVAGLGFACDIPLILIPIGIIYIWETLSVIIQVGYFKISHGKRVFKMAPFHHHLEMCGWSERKIVAIFTLITTVMCVIAWIGAQPRI